MPLDSLCSDGLRLVLFGGKGGVGKTTLAAALAFDLADRFRARRFLVVSTDPAHSLADSFEAAIAAEPAPVGGFENLHGLELDAPAALSAFRNRHRPVLTRLLERGSFLDSDEIAAVLELVFPGLDEVMAVLRLGELARQREYDLIILDTAPTGHTLRLLETPTLMEGWIALLQAMLTKHRRLAEAYAGTYHADETDAFVAGLADRVRFVRRLLRDRERCRFVPVALPEPMVLAETDDLLRALCRAGLPVGYGVLNRVDGQRNGCGGCTAARARQQRALAAFRRRWPELGWIAVPTLREEPRGKAGLRAVRRSAWRLGAPPADAPAPERPCPDPVPVAAPGPGIRVVLFSGKGGVGKTTLASAFAVAVARAQPGCRVLLFSADPAHSVSDCLGLPVECRPTPIPAAAGLFAVEPDVAALLARFRRTGRERLAAPPRGADGAADAGAAARPGTADAELLDRLLELAPPGLDEIMALGALAEHLEEGAFDVHIVDLPPTGHALRFLELPGVLRAWTRMAFEILLKHRRAVRLPGVSELLVEISQTVKRIQAVLLDPACTECAVVTQAGVLPLRETARLVRELVRIGIPPRRVFLNRYMGEPSGCHACQAAARSRSAATRWLGRNLPGIELVTVPDWSAGIAGVPDLARMLVLSNALTTGRVRR